MGARMGGAMPRPVSLQRAGIYAILAPGWGDWYAGNRLRGALLFGGVFLCLVWMSWVAAMLMVDGLLPSFSKTPPPATAWRIDPLLQLAASTLGLIWLWHLGIVTAILTAREQYRLEGRTPDRVPWFAVLAGSCTPGAGQLYDGRLRPGLLLCGVYLLGYLALLPVMDQIMETAQAFAKELAGLQGASPLVLIPKVHDFAMALKLEARFSLPWKLHELLRAYAIAESCVLLAKPRPALPGAALLTTPTSPRPAWETSNTARVLGHLALGWICPGAGQFLQGRGRAGWFFFGLNWGLLLAGAILLALDGMALTRLSLLQDCGDLLAIAAGMEACWRLQPVDRPISPR